MTAERKLPMDGAGPWPDYSDILAGAGVPVQWKAALAGLQSELDALIAAHGAQAANAQRDIAVVLSYATIAAKLVEVMHSAIRAIPAGSVLAGTVVSEGDKSQWLSRIADPKVLAQTLAAVLSGKGWEP